MIKHRLLVAIPVKQDLHPLLCERARVLADWLMINPANRALFEMDLAWHQDPGADPPPGAGKWWQQARARNDLLAAHLRPDHDFVLWIDADLVHYPANLPALLYEASPGDIVAPMVLIEAKSQFYDTLGFIESGRRLGAWPPFWRRRPLKNGLQALDAVGCVYLIPAPIVRAVAYESVPATADLHPGLQKTGHTDHWPVMEAARAAGLGIYCDPSVVTLHADLPKYGEIWH